MTLPLESEVMTLTQCPQDYQRSRQKRIYSAVEKRSPVSNWRPGFSS
ncbi:MAG: hypothetical protein H7308_01480 [Chthonomonadaceae bacterium]|nr:hypothetical protein [Chthonomonadaceae bacterium]